MQTVSRWLGTRTRAPAALLARQVLSLDCNGRRLLARLLNRRRGPLRVETLDYPEVDDPPAALRALEAAGLLVRQPMLSGSSLLSLLRRDELLTLFERELDGLRRQRKPMLIEAVLSALPDVLIHRRLERRLGWVMLTSEDQHQLLTLLYFGDQRGSLAQFVTEALGIVTYPIVALSPPQMLARRSDVDAKQHADDAVSVALENLRSLSIQCDLSHRTSRALNGLSEAPAGERRRCIALGWRLAAAILRQPADPLLDGRRRRALLRLGQAFERAQAWWPALRCLRASGLPPAAERHLRMLWRLGQQPAARAIALMLSTPGHRSLDREFSQSLLRHGIRRRHRRSQEVKVSLLEAPYTRPIEQQALDLLLTGASPGYPASASTDDQPGNASGAHQRPVRSAVGWHCENLFPLGLAGLIYWPALYAPIEGAFTRRFQSTPHGLGEPGFLEERQPLLAALERQWLQDDVPVSGYAEALSRHLLNQQAQNAGILNPLVSWQFWTAERLGQVLRRMDPWVLLKLARFTLHNLADYRTGFPDLVICNEANALCCIEVKGPNDALQPMQRQWLRALNDLGIDAFVLKIEADGRG